MAGPDIRVVEPGAFGPAALEAFLEGVPGEGRPVIGLATGITPLPLYNELRSRPEGRAVVARVRPFAIDEYGGPLAHACSNASFFRTHWDVIPGASAVDLFDPGCADRDGEAARFAAALAAAGGLDFVVLGIGLNGHLAFNEPGSMADTVSRATGLAAQTMESARTCWGASTPTWGFTLGLSELLAAPRVLLLANGPGKAEIVARALGGPVSAACPASFLQTHRGVTVILDVPAAAGLS